MAGDWIKMRVNLDTDPAVVRISSGLKQDRFATVGRLHKIWAWANEHLTDGQDVPIDSDFLDQLVSCPGFSEQMRSVGWLTGRDGSLCFPSFERHNGASAKARALDADRKKNVRKSSEKCPDQNRTETGLEKRREEKSIKEREGCEKRIPFLETRSVLFLEAWARWKRHSRDNDKPIGAMSEEAQLKSLFEAYPEEAEAINAIEFSMKNNWRNIDLKNSHNKKEASVNGSARGKQKTNEDRFKDILSKAGL